MNWKQLCKGKRKKLEIPNFRHRTIYNFSIKRVSGVPESSPYGYALVRSAFPFVEFKTVFRGTWEECTERFEKYKARNYGLARIV